MAIHLGGAWIIKAGMAFHDPSLGFPSNARHSSPFATIALLLSADELDSPASCGAKANNNLITLIVRCRYRALV